MITDGKKALLFDMDGTLIDSMGMWSRIDAAYLRRFHFEISEKQQKELQKALEGMSLQETAVYMKSRFGIPDPEEKMIRDWTEMASDFYLHEVELKPGVPEFLTVMKSKGLRMAIATSNARELAEACLDGRGLVGFFDELVTASETKSKPEPDIYLEAANRLGCTPAECLVFEDIPMGILAGKRAGMQVCAVEDACAEDQRGRIRELADYMIRDFRQILSGTHENLGPDTGEQDI